MIGKRFFVLALSVLLAAGIVFVTFFADAAAESLVFSGRQSASETRTLIAPAKGIIGKVYIHSGCRNNPGEILMEYAPKRVFASRDGTVAAIHSSEGDIINGTALELAPKEKYKIYATSLKATPNKKCHFIHTGEELIIRCVSKGTHRAKGVVTQVTGNEYTVEVTAGELFVGEMVALFRGKTRFLSDHRVGKGTVVQTLNERYGAEGAIPEPDFVQDEDEDKDETDDHSYDIGTDSHIPDADSGTPSLQKNDNHNDEENAVNAAYMKDLKVKVGDRVSRGQLLYSVSPIADSGLILPCDAVITSIKKSEGDTVEKNDILLEYVCPEDVRITFDIRDEDLTYAVPGERVDLIYADSSDDEQSGGTILGITKKIVASKEDPDKENNMTDTNGGNVSADRESTGGKSGEAAEENDGMPARDDLWTVEVVPDAPRLVLGMSVEVRVPAVEKS